MYSIHKYSKGMKSYSFTLLFSPYYNSLRMMLHDRVIHMYVCHHHHHHHSYDANVVLHTYIHTYILTMLHTTYCFE